MEAKSSLPDAWVARIFDKLAVTYGAAWLRKWEGSDAMRVREDWGHELRGFQQSPNAIKHALEHLPIDEPPTVLRFRELCLKAPQFNPPKLPPPPADPAIVARAVGAVARIGSARSGREWAERLRDREKRGDRLTIAQRDMWRAALRVTETREDAPAVEIETAKSAAQRMVDEHVAA